MKQALLFGAITLALTTMANAQIKPEDQIRFRQAGYSFMSWNMGKIKANLGGQFDPKEVEGAANAIAGIANSHMGALFGPGTDRDIGNVKTRVKPEFFQHKDEVNKLAKDFITAANNLSKVAASGDQAAIKQAFGDTGTTCKACHDRFRKE